ncbi:uncharacterized protein LOC144762505 isoform X2 [Lissotriton helveticus]
MPVTHAATAQLLPFIAPKLWGKFQNSKVGAERNRDRKEDSPCWRSQGDPNRNGSTEEEILSLQEGCGDETGIQEMHPCWMQEPPLTVLRLRARTPRPRSITVYSIQFKENVKDKKGRECRQNPLEHQ